MRPGIWTGFRERESSLDPVLKPNGKLSGLYNVQWGPIETKEGLVMQYKHQMEVELTNKLKSANNVLFEIWRYTYYNLAEHGFWETYTDDDERDPPYDNLLMLFEYVPSNQMLQ